MNLIKLYFTVAAIIVVAIWTDPGVPDTAKSTISLPVQKAVAAVPGADYTPLLLSSDLRRKE